MPDVGETVTYETVFSNPGPDPATAVTFTSAIGATLSPTGPVTIPAGGQITVTGTWIPATTGTFAETVTASDPTCGTETGSITYTVTDDCTTGPPTSANGAASTRAWWTLTDNTAELCEVAATITIDRAPEPGDNLTFFALQVFFDDATSGVSAAHMGLQWFDAHPGNTAVNFGGFEQGTGTELSGGPLTNPSTPGNANTMDFTWVEGRSYRYRIYESPIVNTPKAWRAEITDLTTGTTTVIRDLYAGGTHMAAPLVWIENFNDCDGPIVCSTFTDMYGTECGTGTRVDATEVRADYQTCAQGGCDNTNQTAVTGGVGMCTNATRSTAQNTIIPIT